MPDDIVKRKPGRPRIPDAERRASVSTWVKPDVADRLHQIAVRTGRTTSDLVRTLLDRAVRPKGQP